MKSENDLTIDFSNFASGMYFIYINNDVYKVIKKLIRKKIIKRFSALLLLFLFSFQQPEEKLHTVVGKTTNPFWMQIPKTENAEIKPPVLIFYTECKFQ